MQECPKMLTPATETKRGAAAEGRFPHLFSLFMAFGIIAWARKHNLGGGP